MFTALRLSVICVLAVATAASGVPFEVPINEDISNLTVELCVQGECDDDTTPVDGYITIDLDDGDAPTEITLHDFDMQALETINLNITIYIFGFPVGNITATGQNLRLYYPEPDIPFGPMPIVSDTFLAEQIPTNAEGLVTYNATGLVCDAMQGYGLPCADTINLADQGTMNGDMEGTIVVTGGAATVTLNPDLAIPIDPANPSLGMLYINGIVTGSADVPIVGDGDFDNDGDVDFRDFADFQTCFTGDAPGTIGPDCKPGDFDGDDDVDGEDYVLFYWIYNNT